MNKLSILAVDDDPINLEIILESLHETEFDVRCAQGGREALALLDDQGARFEAVILDRMMPDVDGLEVLAHIKRNPRYLETPVVMQTAAAAPDQVAAGLRAGAYYYLTKPYSPAALRTIISSALEAARWRRDLATRVKEFEATQYLSSATFYVRTLTEASELAALLAALCPQPSIAHVGISELLINAIEHGNLAISYEEKNRLLHDDGWLAEVVRRSCMPEYRDRRVRVDFERGPKSLAFTITDEGAGFDWRRYLDFEPCRAYDPNGRGIAIAKIRSFDALGYEGRGNVVRAVVSLTPERPRSVM